MTLARLLKRNARLYGIGRWLRRTPLAEFLRPDPLSGRSLRRHAAAALNGDHSFAGEAAHLGEVLSRCAIRAGFVVDLAAGDGVLQSATLSLFRQPEWKGLAVEMDPARFARLAVAYAPFPQVRVARDRVTPDTVERLLRGFGVPAEFEVLNLDLDSYDLWVAQALLEAFRPLVISMEINEKIPPPVFFSVLYDPDHAWIEDHFYGCSLPAAAEVVRPRGYVLQGLEFNNAFFVRRDVAEGRFRDLAVEEAYESGYRGRAERLDLFPWNRDVEHLQELPADEVAADLRRRFRGYEGKYVLRVRPPRDAGEREQGRPADPPRARSDHAPL